MENNNISCAEIVLLFILLTLICIVSLAVFNKSYQPPVKNHVGISSSEEG